MGNGFRNLKRKPTLNRASSRTAFITVGDPGGIGGEIVLKALQVPRLRKQGRFVVLGTKTVFDTTEDLTGLRWPKEVLLVNLGNVKEKRFSFGKVSALNGRAAFEYIQEAVRLLKNEKKGILVTAPIHKESLQKAGLHWPGHTEMLQDLTGSKKVNMMFVGRHFRISFVTWHLSMKELSSALSSTKVLDAILFLNDALHRYFSKKRPHLAVCALNPHAGEGGLFGDEEKRVIAPALLKARKQGIWVEGPLPADSLFYNAYRGAYDGVVAMYHDQGLIPFKMIEREFGVNVTLGLPFIRTSPDHGTAFDIAGKNRADPRSMIEAILLGHEMAQNIRRVRSRC
ncbi:MAG: 4-hydroxythreonine-4-phosphate dehydrogenase PdxA [Candidatus Omnitrophica bacterium]|nr:4-hydroxythreonine-4-phosphate dehydrogenase PdxA [Candidatus Omnitrophota bacterium]